MPQYRQGDFVKAIFADEKSGESEWMWVKVHHADDSLRVVFGELDNEPIVLTNLHVGMELAVSYDKIRDHMKASSFNQ